MVRAVDVVQLGDALPPTPPPPPLPPQDHPLREAARTLVPQVYQAYSEMRFSDALDLAAQITGRGNQYINAVEPWRKFKNGTEEEKEEVRQGEE